RRGLPSECAPACPAGRTRRETGRHRPDRGDPRCCCFAGGLSSAWKLPLSLRGLNAGARASVSWAMPGVRGKRAPAVLLASRTLLAALTDREALDCVLHRLPHAVVGRPLLAVILHREERDRLDPLPPFMRPVEIHAHMMELPAAGECTLCRHIGACKESVHGRALAVHQHRRRAEHVAFGELRPVELEMRAAAASRPHMHIVHALLAAAIVAPAE